MESYDFYSIKYTENDSLLGVTQKGEIFYLKEFKGIRDASLTWLTHQKYHVNKINDIVCIQSPITHQQILNNTKNDKESILYLCQGSTIRGIDLNSHRFVF